MRSELERYVKDYLSYELEVIKNSYRNQVLLNKLTSYEKALIYRYSDNGYQSLNENLREEKTLSKYGKYLIFALQKLENYQSVCYRSLKFENVEEEKLYLKRYDEAFLKGFTLIEPTFLSCSKNVNTSLNSAIVRYFPFYQNMEK